MAKRKSAHHKDVRVGAQANSYILKGKVLSQIHDQGQVLKEEYRDDGIFIFAEPDSATYGKFKSYKIADQV